MINQGIRIKILDVVLIIYILCPIFVRVGPVSLYHLVILAGFFLWIVNHKSKIPLYNQSGLQGGLLVRFIAVMAAMIAHGEITSLLVYFATPIVLFVYLQAVLNTKERLYHLIDIIILCSIINVVICAIELFTGTNVTYLLCTDGTVTYTAIYRGGILRVAGAFVNAINNGMFCVMVIGLILFRIYQPDIEKRHVHKYWLAFLLNFIVIVTTYSRASIMAAVVVTITIMWIAGALKISRKTLLILYAIVIFLVLFLMIPSALRDQAYQMLLSILKIIDDLFGTNLVGGAVASETVEGVGNRIDLFEWVFEEVQDKLLFGCGKNASFNYEVNQWFTKKSIENEYLSQLYRYGLVGLISKVLLFVNILWYSWKNAFRRTSRKSKFFYKVFLVIFVAYFMSLLTVSQNEEKKVFYILVCCVLVMDRIDRNGVSIIE